MTRKEQNSYHLNTLEPFIKQTNKPSSISTRVLTIKYRNPVIMFGLDFTCRVKK